MEIKKAQWRKLTLLCHLMGVKREEAWKEKEKLFDIIYYLLGKSQESDDHGSPIEVISKLYRFYLNLP
jgi:hypothetical protein